MSSEHPIITLPLLTLGLPGYVSGWLLDAGVSVARLDPAGIRRGIAPAQSGRSTILFDSRSASARTDAEAAESLGYITIDAARLLMPRVPDEDSERTVVHSADPRRRFFEALRPAIESAGGLWMRLADFPSPYRWAVCEDRDSDEEAEADSGASFAAAFSAFADLSETVREPGRLAVADWLKACAAAGRPVRADRESSAVLHRGHKTGPVASPLTWRPTLEQFADWWRFRRQISIRSLRRDRACEIELSVPAGVTAPAPPAVEIWRGRHVAIIPLKSGRMLIQDETLPFQFNSARHPAGFTADAAETEFADSLERSAVVTSV